MSVSLCDALVAAPATRIILIHMEPARLTPAVILPDRRGRRLAVGAALALMVAGGASTYVGTVYTPDLASAADASSRGFVIAGAPIDQSVRLQFESDPPAASVVRMSDGATICVTPCEWTQVANQPIEVFQLERVGFDPRQLAVRLDGGDTLVRASLAPIADGN